MLMIPDAERFPDLFRPHRRVWGDVPVMFAFEWGKPPPELVGNIRMVPFVGDHVVVARSAQFGPMIVGGTLEPDEHPMDTIKRELREEAGASLVSFQALGCARFHSDAPTPYRPHLPHPEWYWVIGYGDVEITGAPAEVEGGERIVAVDVLPPDEAARVFRDAGDGWAADLVMLAAERRR